MPHSSRERGDEQESLLSVAQAAALLGVHPNTLRAWTDAGRLTAYRINLRGDRRYRRGEVERLLAEGASSHEQEPAVADRGAARDRELAALARLAQGSGGSATPTTVCRTAVEALRTTLGVARVAIYVAREGADDYTLETDTGYRVAPPSSLSDIEGVDLEGEAAPKPIADDPSAPLRAQLPLAAGGELVGVLVLEDDPGGPLADLRPAFLRIVAGAIGADLQNARILARARREVARARALRHVTQELTGQLDLNAVLDDIVDRTRSLFDADKAGLWLLDEGAEHPFQEAAARGLAEVSADGRRTHPPQPGGRRARGPRAPHLRRA